jgi:sugar phosphate isomerase/epimerase
MPLGEKMLNPQKEIRYDQAWYEKYAISTSIFRNASLPEALNKIAAGGFKWIEVCGSEFHLDPRSNPDVAAARDAFRKTGIRAHSLHTPFTGLKLGHPDRSLKQEWLRVIGASLAIGVEIGAPMAIIHVTGDPSLLKDEMYEGSRQIAMEYIGELQLRAHALGIRLVLENMTKHPHVRRRFGMTLQELSRDFPDPEIGFCLDTGHAAACCLDMAIEIGAASKRLITTHVDSNDGDTDLHWMPTRGILDWRKTKNILTQSGYAGRFLLELKGHDDPEGIFAQAVAFAKSDGATGTQA